jgi:hypothetical protein
MLAKEQRLEANGGFEGSYDSLADRAFDLGHLARLRARVLPGALDKALIAGSDPSSSRWLAARAAALTARGSRAAIGDSLERLLEVAEGTPRRAMALRRGGHVVANASALRALAAVLRGTDPLYARGIAMANRLLTDGTGPAYLGDREALARGLREAREAMYGHERADAGRRFGVHCTPRRETREGNIGQRAHGRTR